VSSKIGGVDGSSPTAAIGAGRAVQRPQDAATGGAQSSGDSGGNSESVQITGAARQLANLEQAVRDLPAVNDSKVAQISSAIEQGTYTINARHIADQLVQMEKQLGRLPNANSTGPHQADAEPEADAE
jgi:negative regulator of flagellin synthesis FlgM